MEGVPTDIAADCDEIPTVPSVGDVTATDNCDDDIAVVFSEDIANNACGQIITRTWTAADACGNETVGIQVISVGDTEIPVFVNIPADMDIPCGTPLPIMNELDIQVTDNCDNDIEIEFSEEQIDGNCPGNYQVIVTITATDDCGNMAMETLTMNVSDTETPVFTNVPEDITANCSETPELPTPDELSATDNCDDEVTITLEEVVEENNCGQVITRTWTATDDCGNETTASQVITFRRQWSSSNCRCSYRYYRRM